ncbi:MAG: hypothetical protein L0Y66_27570 [Myxococcaceae bacterium]|nr:hypothetical protein [Myxococcaceae bacterium]
MDIQSLSYQPYLEELTAFASAEARREDLLAAKAEYFRLTGEVFEDDTAFEKRMASFLDYYLFDRAAATSGQTPAMELFHEKQALASPELAAAFRSFTETVHGLFEVRKLGKGMVRLRELFSGKDYDVTERRQIAGLEKGDIFEARLIPFNGHLLFSQAFVFHPREACKAIRAEVKRRKKREPERPAVELTWDCARRALKVDRYRQIPVERLYDFTQSKI